MLTWTRRDELGRGQSEAPEPLHLRRDMVAPVKRREPPPSLSMSGIRAWAKFHADPLSPQHSFNMTLRRRFIPNTSHSHEHLQILPCQLLFLVQETPNRILRPGITDPHIELPLRPLAPRLLQSGLERVRRAVGRTSENAGLGVWDLEAELGERAGEGTREQEDVVCA